MPHKSPSHDMRTSSKKAEKIHQSTIPFVKEPLSQRTPYGSDESDEYTFSPSFARDPSKSSNAGGWPYTLNTCTSSESSKPSP